MSNRKLNGFFAYLLLAVVLSSCEARLKNGVVVDKFYEPERVYYQLVIIGKVPINQRRVDDEDFVLIVKGFNGKDTVQQRFEVSKIDFENINVGDSVAFQ